MTWPGARALSLDQPTDQLDVAEGIGQRVATFTFHLTDGVSGEVLGELHPLREARISHDTTRTVKRDLRLTLGVSDTAAINPVTDRVNVAMNISGRSYPLGRYMFTDQPRSVSTGGDTSSPLLMDEMFLVDQRVDRGFTASGTVTAAVLDLLAGLPLVGIDIEPSPYPALASARPGTFRGQILDELSRQGDYLTPWLDHRGVFRMVRTVDPDTAVAALDFDRGHRVIREPIIDSSDLLSAPNRFVVVSSAGDADQAPIVGSYDVPPSAPYSIAARGFVIPEVVDLPVRDTAQAAAVARNLGLRASVSRYAELTTPPDPRHDSYDVIRWRGENWLEVAWSMTLLDGEPMSHRLRRNFA